MRSGGWSNCLYGEAPCWKDPTMRLGLKLALLLACASAAPLTLATMFTLPSGQRELRAQLDEANTIAAKQLAGEVQRALLDKLDSLALATGSLRLGDLDG